MGDFEDLATLRREIKARLERNALDRARHEFADKIIEYAIANATLELPDVLIDQEVEVMHDEFRELARPAGDQRGGLPQGHRQDRRRPPRATSAPTPRSGSRSCSCSRRSPRPRASTIDDADVDAEVARGHAQYAGDQKLVRYFESERGRNFIRSTLRRSRTVEHLVDGWLAAHPDHPPIPHVEDGPSGALDSASAASSAAIDATDPARSSSGGDHAGHDHDHHHDHADHDHATATSRRSAG